jgi:uncharacterized Zn-finger protein
VVDRNSDKIGDGDNWLDTWREDAVVCPWCSHRFTDSWEYNDYAADAEVECEKCGRLFTLNVEHSVLYSTAKMEAPEDGSPRRFVVARACFDGNHHPQVTYKDVRLVAAKTKKAAEKAYDDKYGCTFHTRAAVVAEIVGDSVVHEAQGMPAVELSRALMDLDKRGVVNDIEIA